MAELYAKLEEKRDEWAAAGLDKVGDEFFKITLLKGEWLKREKGRDYDNVEAS